MSAAIVYLDESGDLGFSFALPYRRGGSSRFLTVAALCVPANKRHIPKRIISDLYAQFKWTANEKKWVDMSPIARTAFAYAALKMCEDHADIHMHAMVVKKQNVEAHITTDPNKLYNFMIKLCLMSRMATYDEVTMVPDPRSIKVKSGNSLHDYLQTELWFTENAKTLLNTQPSDSRNCRGIQFADMLAGLVQTRFEDSYFTDMKILYSKIKLNCLFFGR
jgi:hypothetical protein